ncbi:hypothetical protein BC628DRAFT_1423651 [Trametes gibbosa]|nr:hypothetical protein BC628DRAFT_1423651 [Trametes gibbosa]
MPTLKRKVISDLHALLKSEPPSKRPKTSEYSSKPVAPPPPPPPPEVIVTPPSPVAGVNRRELLPPGALPPVPQIF